MYNYCYLYDNNNGDDMEIKDLMSRNLIVGNINDSLSDLATIMRDNDIGFLPIVDNNKVCGVITDRDIVCKIIQNNDNSVKGYLNNIISVNVSDNIYDVICVMKTNRIKRVCVTDNKKIVGIISISDILDFVDINFIKSIFKISSNKDKFTPKVDDFYL